MFFGATKQKSKQADQSMSSLIIKKIRANHVSLPKTFQRTKFAAQSPKNVDSFVVTEFDL